MPNFYVLAVLDEKQISVPCTNKDPSLYNIYPSSPGYQFVMRPKQILCIKLLADGHVEPTGAGPARAELHAV